MPGEKILVFVLMLLILFSGCISQANTKIKSIENSGLLCLENHCFSFEKALTPAEQEQGLMFRTKLPEMHGMLFVLEKQKIPFFWMKNMKFSLDILWLDKNLEIKDISKNLKPCKTKHCRLYSPKTPVLYAFEVNAGTTEKLGIKIGDNAVFK